MKFAILVLSMFTLNSFAVDTECKNINEYQMKMDAHASNYQNAETTRTPDGGAYKYKKVVCQKNCKIIESESLIQKYLPNHPDADVNGYVSFPQIDKQVEKGFISSYAKALVMASKACPSVAKVFENGNDSALTTYKSGNIVSDIFNFKDDGSVASWVRKTKYGDSKIVNL